MRPRSVSWIVCAVALLSSCASQHAPEPTKITVAAASNLTDVFGEVGRAFQAKSGIQVVFSFGSTAQLAQQIENGAPFDLFAAADTEHVDVLVASGKATPDSRAVYASGQLALWIPAGKQDGVRVLKDLAGPNVRFVAIAQPELAPYGKASLQVLKSAGLWDTVQKKVVYANNISLAKQLAASGNADAAFTASSLLLRDKGVVLKIDPHLYHPIQQAIAIVTASSHIKEAKQFRSFLLGPQGRAILSNAGYLVP